MSFTRLSADTNAYDVRLGESRNLLNHILDPTRNNRAFQCRVPFGVVGGNEISRVQDVPTFFDLESELSGRTRPLSLDPATQYQPTTVIQGKIANSCSAAGNADGTPCGGQNALPLQHLPECDRMFVWPQKPTSTGVN
jgi:hypothetical protein